MSATVDIKAQMQGASQVIADTKKMSQGFTDLDASGKKVGSSMGQASKGVDQFGKASGQASKSLDKFAKVSTENLRQQAKLSTAVKGAADGFALAGASAISLWRAYDNVTDAGKRVEISENKVNQAELRLSKAREALNKLQQSGTATALDLQQAQQQVAVASGNVERAEFTLTNAQEALNEAWLNAATSIIPSVFTGISGLTDIYQSFTNRAEAATELAARNAEAMTELGTSAADAGAGFSSFAGDTAELAGSLEETGSAALESGANFTDLGSSVADVSGNIAEAGSDFTSFAGDTLELSGNLEEAAGAAVEAGANFTDLGTSITDASGNFVEFSGDIASFSGDTLEAAGNAEEFGGSMLELESAAATTGGTLRGLKGSFGALALGVVAAGAAVAGLIGLGRAFKDNWMGVGDAVDGIIQKITFFANMIPGLGKPVRDITNEFALWLEGMGLMGDDMLEWLGIADKAKTEQEKLAEETARVNDVLAQNRSTIDALNPSLAAMAKSWGLYTNELAATDPVMQKQLKGLQELDSTLEPARKSTIELARANGVDLRTAFSMTDDQMVDFLVNAKTLGPTMQMQADQAAEAAKQFSEAWTTAFEETQATMGQLNEDMNGFARTAFENMGGEMDVAAGHLKEKVAGSLGFNQDFWDRIFPRDVMHNVWEHNMDFDQLIADTKHIIDRAVGAGFITREQADKWFGPLMDFMREDMPEQADEAFGYLVSSIPEMAARLKPALVRGFEIGPDVKEAVDNGIVQPFLQTLEKGLGADVAGPMMVQHIKDMMPQIRAMSGPLAGMFKQALVDPLTQQERPVQEQVQRIVELLGEINPAWAKELLEFDSNSDKVGDITQKQILDPVEAMKKGVLEAFAAMGNVKAADALREMADNFDEIAKAGFQAKPAIEGVSAEVWAMLTPLERLAVKMNAGEDAIRRTNEELGSFGRTLNSTTGQFQGNIDAFDKWAASVDKAKIAWNNFQPALDEQFDLLGPAEVTPEDIAGGGVKGATSQAAKAGFGIGSDISQGIAEGIDLTLARQKIQNWGDELGDALDLILGAVDFFSKEANMKFADVPDTTLVSTGWKDLGTAIGGSLNLLLESIDFFVQQANDRFAKTPDTALVSEGWTQLGTAIGGALDLILGGIDFFVQQANAKFAGTPDTALVSEGWKELGTAVDGALDLILAAIDIFKEQANAKFGDVPDTAQARSGWEELGGAIGGSLDAINGAIDDWVTTANGKFGNVPDTTQVSSGWDELYNIISGKLSQIGQRIGSWITGIRGSLGDLFGSEGPLGHLGEGPAVGEGGKSLAQQGADMLLKESVWKDAGKQAGVYFVSGIPGGFVAGEADPMNLQGLLNAVFGPDLGGQIGQALDAALGEGASRLTGKLAGKMPPTFKPIGTTSGDYFGDAFIAAADSKLSGWVPSISKIMKPGGFTGQPAPAGFEGLAGGNINLNKMATGQTTQAPQGAGAEDPFADMIAAWTKFAADVQTLVTTMGTNIQTAFTTMFTNLVTGLTTVLGAEGLMLVPWTNYTLAVGQQIALLGTALQEGFILIFTTLAEGITAALAPDGVMTAPWATYVVSVGQQIVLLGTALQESFALIFSTLTTALGTFLGGMVVAWSGHVTAVGGQVNAIGGHLIRLVQGYNLTLQAVQQFSTQGSAAMGRFASAASTAASTGASAMSRLASSVSSAMSRIVSSMNSATSAANSLRSAINSLKSKTITVTTNYVTRGSPAGRAHGSDEVISKPTTLLVGEAGPEHVRVTPLAGKVRRAAEGFSGVVTEPTRFMTGEGYKPEYVSVTPLAGSASVSESHAGPETIIRAGKGAKKTVVRTEYHEDGKKIIYYSDGSKKKTRYKIRKGERWEAAVARDSDEPYVRDIAGRGDYRTPDGRRFQSEDMYKFEEEERQAIIKAKEDKDAKKGASNKPEKTTTTYTTVTKKGKVKKKEVEVDPETGAAKKGSAETVLGRTIPRAAIIQSMDFMSFSQRQRFMGRYGQGGIWGHTAFGGEGDVFPFPLPPGFKKTLFKTYYPDGSVWNNYSDGSREMITPPRSDKKKKKKRGQYGYTGIVRNPTEFTAGEGNKPERVSIEPLTGGNSDNMRIRASMGDREVVITVPLYVDGKQVAKALARHTLAGISSFT